MPAGTLRIFNFGARAFDLTFEFAEQKEETKIYRVAGMERLLALSRRLGIVFSPEELEALGRGTHLTRECELNPADFRTFFT